MGNYAPRGQAKRFTDAQLRAALAEGLKPNDIAARFGVTRQAVHLRVKQLRLTTTAAVVAPQESERHVRAQTDVIEQLARSLSKVNLLMEACDEWLRDAEDLTKYDIGARAGDVEVTYLVEARTLNGQLRTEKRKRRLSELLSDLEGTDEDGARFSRVERGEYKHADPRELILKTAAEARQTVNSLTEIARLLADVRSMQMFRELVISEIDKLEPDVARRIAETVRRSIVLNGLLENPGEVLPSEGSC